MVYIRVTPHFVEWLQFWKDVESCIKWFYRTPGICPGDFYVLLHWQHVTRHDACLSCIYDAFEHKLLQITISMVGLILRATTLFIEAGVRRGDWFDSQIYLKFTNWLIQRQGGRVIVGWN